MKIILASQKLFEKKDQEIKNFFQEYSNRSLTIDRNIAAWLDIDQLEVVFLIRKAIEVYNWINYKKLYNKLVTMDEKIFALEVEQEPSKNNESKVRQKILLETEYGIEDYDTKEIEILLTKIEDSSLEKNNHLPEIFNKVSDQVSEKLKEDI
ncbi:12175_t:CDS:1, partial [Gigaspora margarita]